MRLSRKIGIWFAVSISLASVAAIIAGRILVPPPIQTLEQATKALSAASATTAGEAATQAYTVAQTYLQQARDIMKETSESWWLFRSYDLADSLLKETVRYSNLADSLSRQEQTSVRDNTASELKRLTDSLAFWRNTLDGLLPRVSDEVSYKAAEFRARLALDLIPIGHYDLAIKYCDTIRLLFDSLENSYKQRLATGRKSAGLWRDWINQTIDSSRITGKNAVIVDKAAHQLYVLRSGRIVDSFRCDLGHNSGHQKKQAGDGATPEGIYRASRINNNSKFYRAILLNYPNAEDRARFEANLSSGAIPRTAKIGGLIEIHGHGRTGHDWTDGCVAIADSAMDKLLEAIPIGSTVTIVEAWEGGK
jgi:hypothetical protein